MERRLGVIFDMDGVIVLSKEAHWESWRLVARQRGVDLTRGDFLSTFGQVNADCIPAMFGAGLPAAEVERIADEKERAYREIVRENVPLAPRVFGLLAELREIGARCAVGSSAPPENVDLVLDAGGLREYFTVSVDATQVTRGKPAPDVFLIAAEKLGIEPARCAVIEDAPVGIQAARAAGMRAIGVATTHAESELWRAGAHVVTATLADLAPELVAGTASR